MGTRLGQTFALLLIGAFAARAQLGPALWGEILDTTESSAVAIAEIPGTGYVVAGRFFDSMTLGGTTFTETGGDIYVTCMSGAGAHVWSRHFYGGEVLDLAVAPDGSVILVGLLSDAYSQTYDLGTGPVVSTDAHLFIVALDSSGNYKWSSVLGGPGRTSAEAVAVDALGEIYVAGSMSNAIDLGGGLLPFGGDEDALVAKFDANGAHVWSKAFGDADYQAILDLAIDANKRVVVSGWGAGGFDVGLGANVNSSPNNDSVLLAAFESDGTPIFGRWIESPLAFGNSVAWGPDGEIFLTGSYSSRLEFGDVMLIPVGSSDIFVAELTGQGDLNWARSYGAETNEERGTNVLSDGSGGLVVSGMFRGTDPIDFGGGLIGAVTNWNSAFILFLDGSGAHRHSYGFSYGPTRMNTLMRNSQGAIALAGVISDDPMQPSDGCVDFGSGSLCTGNEWGRAFIQTFESSPVAAPPISPRFQRIVLHPAHPNPFNPKTGVRFTVVEGHNEFAQLAIYDVAGRHVNTLFRGLAGPGDHVFVWDGSDDAGRQVVSGTYYCQLTSASADQTRKLSLVR